MNKKLSVYLAGFALAGSLAIAAEPPEQKYEMPTTAPFDENPAATNSKTRVFMVYGTDKRGNPIPEKTVRITNNTNRTVYPIMRDPHTNLMADEKTGLYDPYDDTGKEYRGYIGYKEGEKFYFGLKPGASITVSIPLVYWNAARMGIETGGQYLKADDGHKPNPLNNDASAQRTITPAKQGGQAKDGVVMWYRSENKVGPADDTEDQLVEWTIRDHDYLKKTAEAFKWEIPDNQLVTLINYDVSNVDSLYIPVSMEALDVWVIPQGGGTGDFPNRNGWKAGRIPEVYGWTGAITPAAHLQKAIREFTAGTPKEPNKLLKQYFGGYGWPHYNFPGVLEDESMPMKIPSGANIFPQSPLLNVTSSYGTGTLETERYMLSSGGSGAKSTDCGWAGGTPDKAEQNILHLINNTPETKKALAAVKPDYLVKGIPPADSKRESPIAPGTTVKEVNLTEGWVRLSTPLIGSSENCNFKFSRPVSDYAAEAMIRLWYSWAEYYRTNWKSKNLNAPTVEKEIKGSIEKGTAVINFNEPHPELVPGMAVKGPGLVGVMTESGTQQGATIILQVDRSSVTVSQVANADSTNAGFKFSPPEELLYTPKKKDDPGFPLFNKSFNFPPNQAAQERDPFEFAQKVYLVMGSMNQISLKDNNNVNKMMQDVIGANMGFIFNNDMKKMDDAKMVTAMIRDMVKSVLRGVSDFTVYPDKLNDKGEHISWYPDPASETGGQKFNVFNLDPFVWFVHVKLGFSGYGFSVDDDTADVGAGGATQLQVTVTGTNGLKNTYPWAIQAPFGPLAGISCKYLGPDKLDTLYNAIQEVGPTSDNKIKITTVDKHNLKEGEIINIDQVVGVGPALGKFKVGHPLGKTFELLDPTTGASVPFSGKYDPSKTRGRWFYPLRPYIQTANSKDDAELKKVFYRVDGDDALGTFEGTFVSVNGVSENKDGEKFRIWRRGKLDEGQLILNVPLANADGSLLPANTYNFNFYGNLDTKPKK